MKAKLGLGLMIFGLLAGLAVTSWGIFSDLTDESALEPKVECLQGFFLEELQPGAEQFGSFPGWLCGINLKYAFVAPTGEVLNDGNTEVPFN